MNAARALLRACAAAACLVAAAPARAHEPVHGFGPNTIWQGATAIELDFEFEGTPSDAFRHRGHRDPIDNDRAEGRGALVLGLAHGLWPDFLVFTELPLAMRWTKGAGTSDFSAGAGDVVVGAKWRFWRDQVPARADAAALVLAFDLPTGRVSSDPPLGRGVGAIHPGITVARDALGGYLWADVHAALPIPGPNRIGAGIGADVAAGVRLWKPRYRGLDFVPLLEIGAWAQAPEVHRGERLPNSGETWVSAGPSFLLFLDRWELKMGARIPVWHWSRGQQGNHVVEFVIGLGVLV